MLINVEMALCVREYGSLFPHCFYTILKLHRLPSHPQQALVLLQSYPCYPLNDLRWPNTWEEMMPTPQEDLRGSNPQTLYRINRIYNSVNILSFCNIFTFMHLADAFIQSDLQCIQVIHLLSVCVFPGNWTHNLCAANTMLYHRATGT